MKPRNLKYLFYKSNLKQLATVSTMVANVALGVTHIVLSLVEMSLFLGFSGAFNITLAFAKYFALERLLRLKSIDEKVKNGAEVKSVDRINNCTLISSFLFFSFGMVITFFYEDPAKYGMEMIYFIAACTVMKIFALLITSLINLKKKGGVKCYIRHMAAAAVFISLALTQRAILYYLNIPYAGIYSGIGAMFFSLLAMIVSAFMIKKAKRQKKYLFENDLLDEKTKDEILKRKAKIDKAADRLKRLSGFLKSKLSKKK